MYRIYPTLLDSFFWYKNSVNYKEAADAKQDLLERINRVPQPELEIQARGKAFKKLVDTLSQRIEEGDTCTPFSLKQDDFVFEREILEHFSQKLAWSIREYFTSAQIVVENEVVELYGYVDNIKEDVIIDVKFVNNYDLAKYFSSQQRLVYPYCIEQNGGQINQFEFLATDGRSIFSEVYNWKSERDTALLKKNISEFIDFVDKNRNFITDKKVFGLA